MKKYRLFTFVLVLASLCLLNACGSGSVKDPFSPTRLVVFGDNLSVRTVGARYTVNTSGGVDNWADQIASSYAASTFVSNAAANALVPAVATQISTFGGAYQASDLVVISAGFRDLINLGQTAGTVASATALGDAYANVVRSIIANGAQHVAVTNVYDFSVSYNARGGTASAATMKTLIRAFNDALKINLGNASNPVPGTVVALIDTEAYMNLLIGSPTAYALTDSTTLACTVSGTSVGIGSAADSSVCTAANAIAGYNNYLYADAVYPTPAVHRLIGSNAYALLKARW
jgi:phospholipase/lecithinase/hemolysin